MTNKLTRIESAEIIYDLANNILDEITRQSKNKDVSTWTMKDIQYRALCLRNFLYGYIGRDREEVSEMYNSNIPIDNMIVGSQLEDCREWEKQLKSDFQSWIYKRKN